MKIKKKILAPCVTVTATMIAKSESRIRIPHIIVDTDLIINLLPDPEFKSLVHLQIIDLVELYMLKLCAKVTILILLRV
jgi:hypothetical protein